LPIIVYGLMTDHEGRPIAVDVYRGNTGDPSTVVDQVNKLRERFHLSRVVLVGDRGMLTQPQIEKLKAYPQMGWITALTSVAIRGLLAEGSLQLSLLDKQNLVEIQSREYPGERLMVCYNPLLAEERKRKREELLAATEKALTRIVKEVERRKQKPLTATDIALKLGKVLGRYKMGKHFAHQIEDRKLSWWRRVEMIEQEAKLDGIYVIRTSETAEQLSAADTVRGYKSLAQVERAFRSLKGLDLLIRPIRHRTEERVPAHIFYACWPTTWSGICDACGRLCCLRTRNFLNSVNDAIRFCPLAARNQHTSKSSRTKQPTDYRYRASPLCSPT
jgi:transposase